jgi:hypothetical protein
MLYRQTCDNLEETRNGNPDRHKKDVWTKHKEFFRLRDDPNSDGLMHIDGLAGIQSEEEPPLSLAVPRLYFSYEAAEMLHDRMKDTGRATMLRLLLDVCGWIFLCMRPKDAAGSPMPRSSEMVVS